MNQEQKQKPTTAWVDINDLTQYYLPISKRKARKFVEIYLQPIRVGNRIYVEREALERLLADADRERFPLDI